jgi:hypothetical protein
LNNALWFNHVGFWHESALEPAAREIMLEEFGEDGLPFNMFFGDGGRIPGEAVSAIHAAYEKETEAVHWELRDLLLIENVLCAHRRQASSTRRQVVVALGDAVDRRQLAEPLW